MNLFEKTISDYGDPIKSSNMNLPEDTFSSSIKLIQVYSDDLVSYLKVTDYSEKDFISKCIEFLGEYSRLVGLFYTDLIEYNNAYSFACSADLMDSYDRIVLNLELVCMLMPSRCSKDILNKFRVKLYSIYLLLISLKNN